MGEDVKKKVIKVRIISPYDMLGRALEAAVKRGIYRCNKYSESKIGDAQGTLLEEQIEESFWLALEDAGLEIK